MSEEFNIRHARMVDIDAITAVEAACFPATEAATREEFEGRILMPSSTKPKLA